MRSVFGPFNLILLVPLIVDEILQKMTEPQAK